jgi:O-antigen ligase
MALWLLLALIMPNRMKSLKTNYTSDNAFFFMMQIIFFGIICFGIFISEMKSNALDVAFMKLSFLMFPVIFLLSSHKLIKYEGLFLKFFIAGNLIASVLCILYATYRSLNISDGVLYYYRWNSMQENYFRYSLFSIFHHPSYFSMYLLLSMSSLIYLKKLGDRFIHSMGNILFYSFVFLHVLMVYFLSSRAGMIIALLLIIHEFFIYIKNRKSTLIKFASLLILSAGIWIFVNNERFKLAIENVKQSYEEGKENEDYPVRFLLWESALEIIYENFWIGTGTGDVKEEFSEKNKHYVQRDVKIIEYNAHNQFLETFMSSGIIGFIGLLALFVGGIIHGIKKRKGLFIIFLTIIIINFLFEAMLNTMAGIIFFVYFYNYFVFIYKPNNKLLN